MAHRTGQGTGLAFSIVIVLVLVILICAAFRLFCPTTAQVAGYWSSPDGDFFEIFADGSQGQDYAVATASGFLGASLDGKYPINKKGCRALSIPFPKGTLRGRIGLGRRRIIWERAPPWHRQGI